MENIAWDYFDEALKDVFLEIDLTPFSFLFDLERSEKEILEQFVGIGNI